MFYSRKYTYLSQFDQARRDTGLAKTTYESNRQYTKVLERKRANNGGDDPENAKNAGKIERLDQMVPNKTYKSWKEDVENADKPWTRGATFISWYVLFTLNDNVTANDCPV